MLKNKTKHIFIIPPPLKHCVTIVCNFSWENKDYYRYIKNSLCTDPHLVKITLASKRRGKKNAIL